LKTVINLVDLDSLAEQENNSLKLSLMEMSYHHREESDEAREPSVAPEDVELVPELLSHDDRQEKHDQRHKRKEVTHVLDYADPKIKQSRFELLRLFQVSNNKCFVLLKPIVNTLCRRKVNH
jgi:hypothetical protein